MKATKPRALKNKTAAGQPKPIAVVIADLHFSLANLEVATTALHVAIDKAEALTVPLVIAGDLTDGKAVIRGEVANRLVTIFSQKRSTRTIILIGNHDLLSEKGDDHALHFLQSLDVEIVRAPVYDRMLDADLIPYGDKQETLSAIEEAKTKRLIMHQGLQTAYMGHYVQDKMSLPPEAFDGFQVISGHYHRAQTIKCGKTGIFTYLGSPFTTSFAEAEDGPKGFYLLREDFSLERVPLGLRSHRIVSLTTALLSTYDCSVPIGPAGDIFWLKVTGPHSELDKLKKAEVGLRLFGTTSFKFDKYPIESARVAETEKLTPAEILDKLIDATGETDEQKKTLKALWREVLHETA